MKAPPSRHDLTNVDQSAEELTKSAQLQLQPLWLLLPKFTTSVPSYFRFQLWLARALSSWSPEGLVIAPLTSFLAAARNQPAGPRIEFDLNTDQTPQFAGRQPLGAQSKIAIM